MKLTKWRTLILVLILGISLPLAGCGGQPDKKVVKIVYANWTESIAMTHLAKAILEEKMGYSVDTDMTDVSLIFKSVANGDYDVFMDTWLPTSHGNYLKEYGNNLIDLGISFKGAKIGLVVPEYVSINSIAEMNTVKGKFAWKIIGIESDAGIMRTTGKAISAYNLDFNLLPGSEQAMAASLKDALQKKEWIVVTGWKPHWTFVSWRLKFLDDPQNIYGEVEHIHIIAHKDFEKNMPEPARFFRNFKLDDEQMGELIELVEQTGDPVKSASIWMRKNEQLVNSWLPKK